MDMFWIVGTYGSNGYARGKKIADPVYLSLSMTSKEMKTLYGPRALQLFFGIFEFLMRYFTNRRLLKPVVVVGVGAMVVGGGGGEGRGLWVRGRFCIFHYWS